MSTKITNKQVKIVSDVNFNEKEIENAIIDAEKNEITNLDIPTKVSDLENDSGYTTTADVNSEIIANSSYIDNELQEGSFNAVTNDAITKGIEKNKVSVVDGIVDTLPSGTLALGQSVYNTTDNKIYKTTYNKEIDSDLFNIIGSLSVKTDGIITGFSDDNYLYSNSEWSGQNWVGWRIDKLVFSIAEARYYSTTTIFSIIRRDDNSVLFGIDFLNRGFGSGTLIFYTKKRDGTTVESATVNAEPNLRYELEITSSNYIKLICAGKTELIRYFGSLSGSDNVEDDFYYGISADIKISSKRVTQYPSTYILGIGKLYGMESIITYQYQGSPSSYNIVWEGDDIVWDEGTLIEKSKIIYDAEKYNLYEYDGTKLISILPDTDNYQKKLTAGDNITISGEGYINFSDTNYLKFINNVLPSQISASRDFIIKFNLNELNRNNTLIYSVPSTDKYWYLEINNENKLSCTYINSSGTLRTVTGTHTFQANKDYWVYVTATLSYPQGVFFIEDNGYNLSTLPTAISGWTFDFEGAYDYIMMSIFYNQEVYLGYNLTNTTNYLKGAIGECAIKRSQNQNIFILSEAVESSSFINNGCLKGPAISAIVPEIDSQLSDVSENPVQNKVITTTLNNKKEKAETITIDTASVTITNVQANKNYVFTNNTLTDITFTACETSFEETSINFTTGNSAPTFTDNANIKWFGGIPEMKTNTTYTIVIFNKQAYWQDQENV